MSMTRMSPRTIARSLAEQIADTVADDIVAGRFKAGEKIQETRLAERLNTSRGPVRDALSLLERNMLVSIKPRSYTVVNRLTFTELEHLFAFRQHVLGIASQYAARNRTEEDLEQLEQGLDRLNKVVKEDHVEYSVTAFPAAQLWDIVIDASHSHIVRQGCLHFTGSNIWATAVQRRIDETALPSFQRSRIKLWRNLLDQISARDEPAAYDAGASLVRSNWGFLKTVFAKLFPEN